AYHAASGLWVDATILLRTAREEMALITEGGADIAAMTSVGFELSAQVFQSNWILGTAESGSQFVTSDRPLGLWRPNGGIGQGPQEPGILKIFPLSPTKVLLVADPTRNPILLHEIFQARVVRLLNATLVRRSYRFVIGGSESLLRLSVTDSQHLRPEQLKEKP
ncbi:MAG: hypothetical protein B7Z63_06325, partial [Ignavibacteriae bacterium 37-53-5]